MTKRGTAAARRGTAVVFTYPPPSGDRALRIGIKWLESIQQDVAAVDPKQAKGVHVRAWAPPRFASTQVIKVPGQPDFKEKVYDYAPLNKSLRALGQLAANSAGHLQQSMLDSHLGGLPVGLSLVILTHGTGSLGNGTGGFELGRHGADLVGFHLEDMQVKGGTVTYTVPTSDPNHLQDSAAKASFLQALRQSPFDRIYLAACGTNSRLLRMAPALAPLINKRVYYNEDPLYPSYTKPSFSNNPRARVSDTTNQANPEADPATVGVRYVGDEKVSLVAPTKRFFQGSTHRAGHSARATVLDLQDAKVMAEIKDALEFTSPRKANHKLRYTKTAGVRWDSKTETEYGKFADSITNANPFHATTKFFETSGSHRYISVAGAVVLYRHALVKNRRANDPGPSGPNTPGTLGAEARFPLLSKFERDADGLRETDLVLVTKPLF